VNCKRVANSGYIYPPKNRQRMKKILLFEDDLNLAFMLTDGLESEGFEIEHHAEGNKDLIAFTNSTPDIVLLDVNLKGSMNGFEVGHKIRQHSHVPIIFITSRTQIEDLQQGFSIGNVDYMKKPFGIRELVLRINEMIKRSHSHTTSLSKIKIGNYDFVPAELTLYLSNEKIKLQKNECAVLAMLVQNSPNVVNKNEILESVWDDDELKQKEASLHNILSLLRSKLSQDKNIIIETIPKVGWKLTVNALSVKS
jgi:two-component system, OmpR family, response regulator TrcR